MPHRTRYDEMKRIKNETRFNWNILFCGYVRQPIYSEKTNTGYFVEGTCSLTSKRCLRLIDKDTKMCGKIKGV